MSLNLILMYLFLMLWCHVIDDYFLQGCMCNLKQKIWWEKNAPDKLYRYDYFMALFCHSSCWAMSIMIPTIFAGTFIWWLVPINLCIHFIVDDLKANRHRLNLIEDQSIHFIQILLTWLTCFIWLV